MKKIVNAIRTLSKSLRRKAVNAVHAVTTCIRAAYVRATPPLFKRSPNSVFTQNSGEGFVDTALKILMAVVIGALILAGLYALFGDTILPTLTRRITELFNYAG